MLMNTPARTYRPDLDHSTGLRVSAMSPRSHRAVDRLHRAIRRHPDSRFRACHARCRAFDSRLLIDREIGGVSLQFTQAVGVAEWEIDRHGDPLPALGRDRLGLHLQLFGNETVEQRHVLQPAAIVVSNRSRMTVRRPARRPRGRRTARDDRRRGRCSPSASAGSGMARHIRSC